VACFFPHSEQILEPPQLVGLLLREIDVRRSHEAAIFPSSFKMPIWTPSLVEITSAASFSDQVRSSRTFKRLTDLTAAEFREAFRSR